MTAAISNAQGVLGLDGWQSEGWAGCRSLTLAPTRPTAEYPECLALVWVRAPGTNGIFILSLSFPSLPLLSLTHSHTGSRLRMHGLSFMIAHARRLSCHTRALLSTRDFMTPGVCAYIATRVHSRDSTYTTRWHDHSPTS